ncbi:hypothetical protein BS636_12270 [Acinetobacter sp. LoGeW2-3]|uniref:hypothetical protein n=1 Tax=Acinetobacter sp. LoGeW2-3 TaxID=1808001 RepID=UPI000C05C0BB|nr:hypothetical protein [Acinetobacter sp. LoGeW2-3]ATO20384.1 hypothetical protein BS636_12270 [Acinetobacter sp. LoGeW2-3]
MKDTLHISIFGLSLSLINVFKSTMMNVLSEKYNLVWTNLTDQKLQLLLVNKDFIDLPHIQKIKDNNLTILQVEKNPALSSQVIEDTLFLPFEQPHALVEWLQDEFLSGAQRLHTITQLTPTTSTYSAKIAYQSFRSILDELFQSSGHSKYMIKNGDERVALIDLEQHCFYPANDWYPNSNTELSIEPADLNSIVQFRTQTRPEDLNQGIWNFVWCHLQFVNLEYPDYYRLTKWPQIKNFEERKDLFKLAALFSEGSSVAYAQQQLKLGEKYIHQFLCTAQLANMLEPISSDQAKFFKNATDPIQKQGNKMMSFFSKLRKKLGI